MPKPDKSLNRKACKIKTKRLPRRPKVRRVAAAVVVDAIVGMTDPLAAYVLTGIKQATKKDPAPTNLGKIVFPGGGVNKGEKRQTTAYRETKEESGVLIEVLRLKPLRDRRKREQTSGALTSDRMFYLSRQIGGRMKKKSRELDDIRFRRVSELLADISALGTPHAQMLQAFVSNGAMAKALRMIQLPLRKAN